MLCRGKFKMPPLWSRSIKKKPFGERNQETERARIPVQFDYQLRSHFNFYRRKWEVRRLVKKNEDLWARVESVRFRVYYRCYCYTCGDAFKRRIVDVFDSVQRRRCTGGVSIPKMPSLEALRLQFATTHHEPLPVGYAPRPKKISRGSHSLRSRPSHSLSWLHYLSVDLYLLTYWDIYLCLCYEMKLGVEIRV